MQAVPRLPASFWEFNQMKLRPDSSVGRLHEAVSLLQNVIGDLAGEFTVEHLLAAEHWHDRLQCLKWAVESRATVAEMKAWRRAQNGWDLFSTDHD